MVYNYENLRRYKCMCNQWVVINNSIAQSVNTSKNVKILRW